MRDSGANIFGDGRFGNAANGLDELGHLGQTRHTDTGEPTFVLLLLAVIYLGHIIIILILIISILLDAPCRQL